MINLNISFIGVGHISHAIINGLLRGKIINPQKLILSGPHLERFNDLGKKYGVKTITNNIEAVRNAEIVFIGVRPKVVKEVAEEIKSHIKSDALIISIAAGVTFDLLHKYFSSQKIKLIKIIPSIPVAYGLGVVGWVGDNLNVRDKIFIKSLFKPLGLIIECKDEKSIDKLSLISGCGIGYVAYFMRNLEKVTKEYGFSEDETRRVVNQIFKGTLKHLEAANESPDELIKAVATKGGITEEVLNGMEAGGFLKLFSASVNKGYDKIKKL